MKKVLCLVAVLMVVFIPLAVAGIVVDSRINLDITEVEIIQIEYAENNGPNDQPNPNIEVNPILPMVEIVETPPAFETVYEDINTSYEVTVNYVSITGEPIGTPVTIPYEAGQPVDVPAVVIENFNPTPIEANTNMPNRNVQVTVVYVPDGFDNTIIDINEYNTPLGLGASMMNVGVCVE